MPSYLEREQLIPVQQVLPASDSILKLFQSKLDLYGRGAGQLKSKFNDLQQTSLTKDYNKDILAKTMNQVDSNLTKASTMDFSIMDNVQDAAQSFNPMYANTEDINNMWGDHFFTEKVGKELALAESQKGTSKFNQDAYDSIIYSKEQFRMDPDNSSWRSYMNSVGNYSEYYDVSKEMGDLTKRFKDVVDSIELTQPTNNGYMLHTKDSSWYKERFSAFVQANASPQLQQQLKYHALAEYRKTYVGLHNSLPPEVADAALTKIYKDQFENTKAFKVAEAKAQKLYGEVMLEGLDKNSKDYTERLKEHMNFNAKAKEVLKQVQDQQFLPEFGKQGYNSESEHFAVNQYTHDWLDRIGQSYAHKEVVKKYENDPSYWNAKNYNLAVTKTQWDQQMDKLDNQYKNKLLNFQIDKADKDRELEYIKLGYKYNNKTGQWDSPTDLYAITDTDGKSADPEKVGQDLLSTRSELNETYEAGAYNALLGQYFNNSEFFNNIKDPNTKLKDITTNSSAKTRNDTIEAIANYLIKVNSTPGMQLPLYNNFVDVYGNNDPAILRERIKNMPAARVQQLLHQTLTDPKMREIFLETLKNRPDKGVEIRLSLESAGQRVSNYNKEFDDKYGYVTSEVLSKYNYPAVVDPIKDKALWDQGIRGYKQDGEHYRVPSEDEIGTFANFVKKEQLPGSYDPLTGTIVRDENPGFRDPKNMMKEVNEAIGKNGTPSLNSLERTIHVTDGENGNRQQSITSINSIIDNMSDQDYENDKNTRLTKELIHKYPGAIDYYRERGNLVDGTSKLIVHFDINKIPSKNTTDRENADAINTQLIAIKTNDSAIIDPIFKKKDPVYIEAITKGLTDSKDWNNDMPSTTLTLENMGGFGGAVSTPPKFEIKGKLYRPIINQLGEFRQSLGKDVNGKDILSDVKYETLTSRDFPELMNMSQKQFDDMLRTNPVDLYESLLKNINRWYIMTDILERNKNARKISDIENDAQFQSLPNYK